MLNFYEGTEQTLDGQRCIRTTGRGEQHALYGPYETLESGEYLAEFWIARGDDAEGQDDLCAILDVTANDGRTPLAFNLLFADQLGPALRRFQVAFVVTQGTRVEFRVTGRGEVPIVVADNARAQPRQDADPAPISLAPACPLLDETPDEVLDLFRRGYPMRRDGDRMLLRVDDLTVAARERDDINFLDEVFNRNAYNLLVGDDQCFVDIGMNVGLTSLLFASRAKVKEVHAFEPFASTFAKAELNFALNPAVAAKIDAHHCGLSDRDGEVTVSVPETSDSGSRVTFDVAGGVPTNLTLRHAATTLAPIVAAAKAKGRAVIVKVDCEGSEFPIFEALFAAGLVDDIDAFMVEWHAMFADKHADDITGPLLARGFTVIDLSPKTGNGFFYAVNGRSRRPESASLWRRIAGGR